MKDFCKWLGVDEKIAKIVVWLFIFMCMLVIFNAAFESIGIPYYKLTVENLSKINYPKVFEFLLACIVTLFNFYAIVFFVFKIKEFKKIFKYSIIYLILNTIISIITNQFVANLFIIIFILIFSFIYSNKNWKYILYSLGAYAFSAGVQYICYLYKIRFIDFTSINYINKFLISLDYFVIMVIVIFIKEIIIKKKGEK